MLDLAVITSRSSEVVVRVVDGRPVIVPPPVSTPPTDRKPAP